MTRPICASLAEDVTKQTRAAVQWLCNGAICFPYSHPKSTLQGKLCFPLRRRIMQQKHMSGIKKKKKRYHCWKMCYEVTPPPPLTYYKNTTGFLMVGIPHRITYTMSGGKFAFLGNSLSGFIKSLNFKCLCMKCRGIPCDRFRSTAGRATNILQFWNPAKGSST